MKEPAPDRIEPYLSLPDAELILHFFEPRDEPSADRPVIVFFFGGGWNGGTPKQFYPQCQALSEKGWIAGAAEYRTKTSHGTTPVQAAQDARACMRWVRAQAGKWGADEQRIWAGGGSAGANLAAQCALKTSFDHPEQDLTLSCKPDGLVLYNPVIDNGPGGYGYERLSEDWEEFSPMHAEWKGTPPPTLVTLGDSDTLIPVSTGENFCKRLQALGGISEFKVYPGQPHGFFNYREGENPLYDQTLADVTAFLVRFAGYPA